MHPIGGSFLSTHLRHMLGSRGISLKPYRLLKSSASGPASATNVHTSLLEYYIGEDVRELKVLFVRSYTRHNQLLTLQERVCVISESSAEAASNLTAPPVAYELPDKTIIQVKTSSLLGHGRHIHIKT
jgi:hypothetical protein